MPDKEHENSVDEFASDVFDAMGLDLSDKQIEVYNRFKYLKDKVLPGRITPEGFAMIAVLCEYVDGPPVDEPLKKENPASDNEPGNEYKKGDTVKVSFMGKVSDAVLQAKPKDGRIKVAIKDDNAAYRELSIESLVR